MKLFCVSAAIIAAAGSASAAVLVSWDSTGMVGNEASMPVSFTAPGISSATITRGPGLNANAGANSFNSSGWQFGDATDYVQLSFTIDPGYSVNLTGFQSASQASATGPRFMGFYTSTDGFASPIFTTDQPSAANLNINESLSLSGLTGSVSFRFRPTANIAPNGGTISANGTWRIWDFNAGGGNFIDTNFQGEIIPAPASIALVGLAGLVAGRRRR